MKNVNFRGILRKSYLIYLFTAILAPIFIVLYFYTYSNAANEDLSNNLVRLHVVANSNSEEDQQVKLKVRDAILEYMNKHTNASSAEEAREIIETNINEIIDIANKTLKQNGFNYNAYAQLGIFPFPTKIYGDVSLPAGEYQALRITLGEASGNNWWCVMFPPLCFVDVSNGVVPEQSKQELKNTLSAEDYDLITKKDDNKIKFKFKVVEILQETKIKLATVAAN